ncbi:MAG: hypothetical protein ABIU96_13785 [Rhodanobacter sp.]
MGLAPPEGALRSVYSTAMSSGDLMIELEIQGLAASREGLLIEISRLVLATGFTLRRQRLVADVHGILLTVVVQGPRRKQRALENLLEACERLISYHVAPFVDGAMKPHFAASLPPVNYTPDPPPTVAVAETSPDTASSLLPTDPTIRPTTPAKGQVPPAPLPQPQVEAEFEFIQPIARAPAVTPATPVEIPAFIEMVPLAPDVAAVDKALRSLEYDYPHVLPGLLALSAAVPEAARDASLALAGQRIGAWVFAREYALERGLDLLDAISRIGAPALRALIEVDQQDAQVHIHNSPLCTEDGHSGCSFFGGFLEGLLGPTIAPRNLSIFPVCCRSYSADACVLAISD